MSKFVYLAKSIAIKQSIHLYLIFYGMEREKKILRTTLIGQKENGGVEMSDPQTFFDSLKIKWINSLKNKEAANWKILPIFFLKCFGKHFIIFNMNLDSLRTFKNITRLILPIFM